MRLGIHSKLFFTILLSSIIVVIGMMLFTRWSIHSGFERFIEDRQAFRINQITERLLDVYEVTDSWDGLYGNKRLWLKILLDYRSRREHDDDDHYEDSDHRMPDLHLRRLLRGRDDIWPPEHILRNLSDNDRRLPFEMRIMLFDADKEAIFARQELLSASQLFPVLSEGKRIGYLALLPGPVLSGTSQLRFLERQFSGLIYIAIGVIALSIIISVLLARRLVKPLHEFRATARELAEGNYDSRVTIERRDELGELAHDINALGASLKASEQARKQWVADIAHELRTPLTIMQSELEALQAGVRPLEPSAIESLHEDAMRLGRLINDLYELSITDLGALSYRKQAIDIGSLLETVVRSQQSRFDEAGLSLKHDTADIADLSIHADEERLLQLFRNLLDNSLRYTNPGGELQITARQEAGLLVIDFMDSSPGVPQQSLLHLFERLYRVDESRNRHTGGSGLGLAIVRNIVEAHEGTIEARLSPLGGLWLHLSFPIQQI